MCKFVAVVIWVVGAIGSGMLGKIFETYSRYGGAEYNWIACLVGLFSVFITGALFWGIGDIVAKLTEANSHLYNIYESQRVNGNRGYGNTEVKTNVTPSATSLKSNGGNWTCKKCATHNINSALYCSNCGDYK